MEKNTHISLRVKISEVNLSIRTMNCLDWLNFKCNYESLGNYFHGRKKVYTLGDLITYQRKELLRIRNFGKKCLTEIEDVLEEYGLKLGMYIDEPKLAVEWLAKELYEKFEMKGNGALFDEIVEKAIAKQREQTIDFTFIYLVEGFKNIGQVSSIEDFYNENI